MGKLCVLNPGKRIAIGGFGKGLDYGRKLGRGWSLKCDFGLRGGLSY